MKPISTISSSIPHSRREFLGCLTAAAAAVGWPAISGRAASPPSRFKIGGFTKPFQSVGFEASADIAARVGWDGVEIPVRRGGQVLPERVKDDLPRLADAMRQRNLEIFSIATDIRNASDPLTEPVLRAAAKLKIKTYRLGAQYYDLSRPIAPQLEAIRRGLAELQALNRELGLCAAYENHSGENHFGAPIWDLMEVIRNWNPREFGVCFDTAHATIEGGLDWEVQFHLVEPFLRSVYVKDFAWRKVNGKWIADWCPLDEGMVNPRIFQLLLKSDFRGPLIQHFEYPLGEGDAMRDAMRRDLHKLQGWMAASGSR